MGPGRSPSTASTITSLSRDLGMRIKHPEGRISEKGDAKMKKRSFILMAMLMVALLSTLSVPVYAGPPENAGGLWRYYPSRVHEKVIGCNTFWTTHENGEWTGIFEGKSSEEGKVVAHCNGDTSFNAIVSFDEVMVDGKRGSLTMSVVGQFPADATEWTGSFVITHGTGELKHLRGQGIFWGAGADWDQWGYVNYAVNYHFEQH